MRNNYNKKKISFISKFKLIKYLFIFLIFILASFYFYDYILEKDGNLWKIAGVLTINSEGET